jgi:hypothetical protein
MFAELLSALVLVAERGVWWLVATARGPASHAL